MKTIKGGIQMKDVTNSANRSARNQQGKSFRLNFSKSILYVIAVVIIALYYYKNLPPIHYASPAFWVFLALILVLVGAIEWVTGASIAFKTSTSKFSWEQVNQSKSHIVSKVVLSIVGVLIVIAAASHFILSPLFFAESYSKMIQVQNADFATDFPKTDVTQIPLIDRDTASRLGNRRIGALTDLVSQFEVAEDYTQINIQNHPYRVSPLKYAGFWKWFSNHQDGIPNYMQVDMVTGDVEVKKPDQPIRYSEAEYFNRNIHRHLRFHHPFTLFGSPSFEVDDEGTPYYIASTYSRNFFLREPEVNGLITVNALTGESKHYNLQEIPHWVDRVYSAELILHQLEMNGKYKLGFWNTIFSKKGVTVPTKGYNYLPMNDDIYLYTGITSVASDNSNIGFVLVNTRTKEAKMYPVSAAEEFSAMSSAEGSVQETGYKATFPLLISLNGKPMYILSLKDSSGLIKKYALIDVENYQNVYVETSVSRLIQKYEQSAPTEEVGTDSDDHLTSVTGKVQDIQGVVINGNTIYYLLVDDKVYRAPATIQNRLPFLEKEKQVEMQVTPHGEVRTITIK